jgi:hypothetical protein
VKTIGKLGGGWALVDLLGKRRKVRSIPLKYPIKQGIDEWLAAAQITKGRIFRAIRKNGKPWGTGLEEEAVLRMVRRYAALVGHENFAPRRPALLRVHLLRCQSAPRANQIHTGPRQAGHHGKICQ